MTTALLLVALAGLLVYGLDRNHSRSLHTRLAGSTDVEDRDLARTTAELAAAATWSDVDRVAAAGVERRAVSARTAATVRPASATR
ncbi:hypothetical protein V5P93_000760 [Actinokineospora auranticolor]|uniref:Uncharacterized protein n=1 Tax=Actinokineospora auranticolor TaxID=155976 RepID=A0A2S6GYX3_9PSEU|nr:hypothetical protein [Actinokineospora auranticolor]PPK70360.1 hypothetical protein CLV40_102273 [Actinokineospora auranticolor]